MNRTIEERNICGKRAIVITDDIMTEVIPVIASNYAPSQSFDLAPEIHYHVAIIMFRRLLERGLFENKNVEEEIANFRRVFEFVDPAWDIPPSAIEPGLKKLGAK